jgi:high-affinity iron transporter
LQPNLRASGEVDSLEERMFSTLMITFREGVEALLIVAIALMYLRRTGREFLVPAIHAGWAVALAGSVLLGVILARVGAMTPFAEGVLALVAAVLVISCTSHMLRMGRKMKGAIDAKLEQASLRPSAAAYGAVFLFILLMVGREGIETATMIASLATASDLRHLAVGGVLGFALAGLMAWAWTRYGRRVDLTLFFRVTAVFMVLFSIQLTIYAFHEFTEAAAVPFIDNEYWLVATEDLAEGTIGQWLSYSLLIAPAGFLLYAWITRRVGAPAPGRAEQRS